MTTTEAMKLALEALECAIPHKKRIGDDDYLEGAWTFHNKAITALREALSSEAIEQPAPATELREQEPVAFLVDDDLYYPEEIDWETLQEQGHTVASLYTSPPAQRTWVGLTDEEILIMSRYDLEYAALIGEVQRKLKEKNCG